jgi:subtilisin family serine protease
LTLLWYDGPDTSVHIPLDAVIMDGEGEEIWQEEIAWVSSPRGTESRLYSPLEPAPEDSSSFFVQVTNQSDQDQQFHFMITSTHSTVRFQNSVSSYLVLLPSTADNSISVAASTHRTQWTDFEGNDHEYRHVTVGGIANFSSPGPRIDGALKPNITAPGQLTISCRHSENIWLDGALVNRIISNSGEPGLPADYLALEGTSMSSPAAAGSAALILQANPDLTPADLRWKIYQSAHIDTLTGETPNVRWGWGKLNVISALETSIRAPDNQILPTQLSIESVYPNPFNSSISVLYNTRNAGSVVANLYDLSGRLIGSEEKYILNAGTHSWSLQNITKNAVSGSYFISLSANDVISYRKIVLEK